MKTQKTKRNDLFLSLLKDYRNDLSLNPLDTFKSLYLSTMAEFNILGGFIFLACKTIFYSSFLSNSSFISSSYLFFYTSLGLYLWHSLPIILSSLPWNISHNSKFIYHLHVDNSKFYISIPHLLNQICSV